MILLSLSKKRVCFSNEKWFVLHPLPNLQTNHILGFRGGIQRRRRRRRRRCVGSKRIKRWWHGWFWLMRGLWWWSGWRTSRVAKLPSLASNIFKFCRKKSGQKCAFEQEDNWWIKNGATGLTTNAVLNFLGKMFLRPSHQSEVGDWTAAIQSRPQSFGLLFLVLFNDPRPLSKAINLWWAESNGWYHWLDCAQASDWRRSGKYQVLLGMQSGKWRSLWSLPEEAVKTALHKESNAISKIFLWILLMEL